MAAPSPALNGAGRGDSDSDVDGDGDGIRSRVARATFAWVAGAAAALLCAIAADPVVNVYDEGIVLTGAARILDGAIAHRDFYANYGPGQFHVLAGLFRLLGDAAWVGRLWDAVVKGGIVALAVVIVGCAAGPVRAVLAAGGVAAVLAAVDYPLYPIWPALLASLVAVLAVAGACERPDAARRHLAAAGVAAGVAALFRYDVGGFVALACAIGWATARSGRLPEVADRAWPGRVAGIAWIAAGALAVVAPLLVAYAVGGLLPRFGFDVFLYPLRYYGRMRSLPFPGFAAIATDPRAAAVYVPLVAVAAALAALAGSARWRARVGGGATAGGGGDAGAAGARRSTIVLLIPLVLLFTLKGTVRVSVEHMALAIVPSVLLLAALPARARPLVVGLALCALALLVPALAPLPDRIATRAEIVPAWWRVSGVGRDGWSPSARCPSEDAPPRLRCLAFEPNRLAAIRYVRARSRPGDTLYVGTGRHDKIFANDVAIYFLSGLAPATRWYHFDPGIQNHPAVQREMITELERSAPPFVILISDWDGAAEPNDSARSTGAVALDDYLANRYRTAARYGSVEVRERR